MSNNWGGYSVRSSIKKSLACTWRHALLCTQVLFFLILFLSDHIIQSLTQAAYCIVVFTSPLLLLIYGKQYMQEKAWHWSAIPFLAETVLTFLFVGAMIFGIRLNAPSGALFARLLTVYTVDAVLCILGCFLVFKS